MPPPPIQVAAAPSVQSNFDGINQSTGCGGCSPPDPTAATSGSEIVELVNTFIQVTDNTGTIQCGGGVTLNRLLRSTDSLTDPRIQFDNVNNRFSLAVTIDPASTSATPAMYVAASESADACGTWRVYRLTFNGSPFPAGTMLDFPILGQDRNALLISTRNLTPSNGTNFTVFGVSKSAVYSGAAVSFSTFNVASLTAPVINAGQPMVSSPFSYFLAAVPGTGYRLYRLTKQRRVGRDVDPAGHDQRRVQRSQPGSQPARNHQHDRLVGRQHPRGALLRRHIGLVHPRLRLRRLSPPSSTARSTSRTTPSQPRWPFIAAPATTSIRRWRSA